jgi:hypothetical protein
MLAPHLYSNAREPTFLSERLQYLGGTHRVTEVLYSKRTRLLLPAALLYLLLVIY